MLSSWSGLEPIPIYSIDLASFSGWGPSPESQERSQALSLVAEAEEETEKDQPNHVKLRGMLSGIAATVRTLGSAREAFEALKAAGALLGLSLL